MSTLIYVTQEVKNNLETLSKAENRTQVSQLKDLIEARMQARGLDFVHEKK